MNGFLVIDKPTGISSREALDRLKRQFPKSTRFGHTGTLDPLATGVLVAAIGQGTKLAEEVQGMGKSYVATIRLGATSSTDDADGMIVESPYFAVPSQESVEAELRKFLGETLQLPPAYSAVKVDGRRAYKMARAGREVALSPRLIHIAALEVLRFAWPEIELLIDCGKGTYIRSIARDLGAKLGCGGYITALKRTRVGPFTREQAVDVKANAVMIREKLRPLEEAILNYPRLDLEEAQARRMLDGQAIPTTLTAPKIAVFAGGRLRVIAQADGKFLRPRKGFQ